VNVGLLLKPPDSKYAFKMTLPYMFMTDQNTALTLTSLYENYMSRIELAGLFPPVRVAVTLSGKSQYSICDSGHK
jgi:hypothetical protein